MENVYKITVLCTRCDFRGEISLEKGKKIEDQKCENCGLAGDMKKDQLVKVVSLRRRFSDYN